MKNNAHLYWPPSVLEEYLASIGAPKVQTNPPVSPEIAQAVRAALEQVAAKLESKAGNKTYQAAWRIAARIIRENKPD